MVKAIDEMRENPQKFVVGDFCLNNEIHKTTFNKNFLYSTGITPKEFASVIRFNQSFYQLYSGEISSFTRLAVDCGYYDQSHMIREFKRYCGFTPKELFQSKFRVPLTLLRRFEKQFLLFSKKLIHGLHSYNFSTIILFILYD